MLADAGGDDVEGHRHSARADSGTSDDDVEGHRVPKN
jgi:hypothetical protein